MLLYGKEEQMPRLKKNRQWEIVFPRQGNWYFVTELNNVASIIEYLRDHYQSTRIEIVSFSKDDGRKWAFKYARSIDTFYAYLSSTFGQGGFKLRMRVTKRHHPRNT